MIVQYENYETRTNIFSMMAERLELWLKANKIEYRIVKEKDIPDEWAHGCTYQGKSFMSHYCCVISKLNSAWLLQLVDMLGNISKEEFKGLMN